MKTTRLNATVKTMFLLVLAITILSAFQSCATTQATFQKSSVVPAAEGKVTVNQDKNNNYVIKMKISNLADIERLIPEKKSYVVWMEADRGYAKNIGLISSSNQLNASFETVATQEPKRIFITAEEDENVQYPDSVVVLTTGIIYK
jgi:ABC-type Fe3+-citrate transport system substrate-binding protein